MRSLDEIIANPLPDAMRESGVVPVSIIVIVDGLDVDTGKRTLSYDLSETPEWVAAGMVSAVLDTMSMDLCAHFEGDDEDGE